MKKPWNIIASILQLVVGLGAVAAFVVVCLQGESMGKWIPTLILALGFIGLGIVGIVDAVSGR